MITSPLPLFPLSLVLLPGAVVPLHIFEPRYRAMLGDVTARTQCFGLIALPDGIGEEDLPSGRVGCIARVTAVDTMADGRANIVIVGEARFRFETYLDAGTPYRMGHVGSYDDTTDDPQKLAPAAAALRELAGRAIRASMTMHDVASEAPLLETDDAALSFQVAHLLNLGDAARYELLTERSPLKRVRLLDGPLRAGLDALESGAELHTRAKTNGHHHGPPPA